MSGMNTNLITQTAIIALDNDLSNLLVLTNSHISSKTDQVHGVVSETHTYLDSAGDAVGDKILDLTINGTTYYLPASLSSSGMPCTTQCSCNGYTPPYQDCGNNCCDKT